MSKINKSLGDYVEYGFQVQVKHLSRKEWHSILHYLCHHVCFGILADLPSVPADNKILSDHNLWGEHFSYNTSGNNIPSVTSSEKDGVHSISENTKLIPLVRLRFGKTKISYLLIHPDGFAKWVKCTHGINSKDRTGIRITNRPFSYAWMSEEELLTFIMKDPSIGFRIIATFNRLIGQKIDDEKKRITEYLKDFERSRTIIREIKGRICL